MSQTDGSWPVGASRTEISSSSLVNVTVWDIARLFDQKHGTVCSWRQRWDDWPPPVGRVPTPGRTGTGTMLYDLAAITACIQRHHRLDTDRWTLEQMAAEYELSIWALATLRQRGDLPEPDGVHDRRPWWKQETVRLWWAAHRRRPGEPAGPQAPADDEPSTHETADDRLSLLGVAQLTGLSYNTLKVYHGRGLLPPRDGSTGTSDWPWWRRETIEQWNRSRPRRRPRYRPHRDETG